MASGRLKKRAMDRDTLANERAQSELRTSVKQVGAALEAVVGNVTTLEEATSFLQIEGDGSDPMVHLLAGKYVWLLEPFPGSDWNYNGTVLNVIGLANGEVASFLVYNG